MEKIGTRKKTSKKDKNGNGKKRKKTERNGRKKSEATPFRRPLLRNPDSSGASGGPLYGGASFKVELNHLLHGKRVGRTAKIK